MASALALLLLSHHSGIKFVHIVYLNQILLRKDREDFADLWSMIPQAHRVLYHGDIDFTPKAGSVVVLDESDQHVFNAP